VLELVLVNRQRKKLSFYALKFMFCFSFIQGRPQGDLEGPRASYVKKGKAIKDLSSVIDYVKPTVLMGSCTFIESKN
jgi:hypothetical protein